MEKDELEVVCDIINVKKGIEKLREAHPYEEPEKDTIPLIAEKYFK